MRKSLVVLGLAVFCGMTMLAQNNDAAKDKKNSGATARETGSGMATGKRTATESNSLEQKNIVHRDLAARETGSGMATGKKTEVSGDPHEYSAREAGSGMATGRQAPSGAANGVTTSRETGSGMATGRRQHQPVTMTESTDATDKHKNNMSGAQSNPMYKDGGMKGDNPLYENKDKKVQSGVQATGSAVASGAAVVKTKTKSNQSNDRTANGSATDTNGGSQPSTRKGEPDRQLPAPAQPMPQQSKKNN